MPIYEYLCEDCGTKFEKLVRRSSDEILCPSCGQKHLKQELSVFSAPHSSASNGESMPSCPGGTCRMPDICGRN